MAPEWLTPQQASAKYGPSVQTLANWRVRGYGPTHSKRGKFVWYLAEDFDRWIEEAKT